MNNYFNNINSLKLINKWKFHLLIIVLISVILSIFFSSPAFIKPKYKSEAIIYPSNIIPYSSETATEQMLQLFMSTDIQKGIIKKFDLAKHYKIDTTKKHFKTILKKELESNILIKKTEYESVAIEVLDVDPVIACNIIKEMINLFNLKARTLQRTKTKEVVIIYKNLLDKKKKEIDSIENRINHIRTEYNILDYALQTKEATRQYAKINSSKSHASKILKNLEDKGGEFILLNKYFENITNSYNETKLKYDKSLSDLSKELTYTNLITSPVPADKKSYPVRWLIVFITTLATLFFSIIIIAVIENHKHFNYTD